MKSGKKKNDNSNDSGGQLNSGTAADTAAGGNEEAAEETVIGEQELKEMLSFDPEDDIRDQSVPVDRSAGAPAAEDQLDRDLARVKRKKEREVRRREIKREEEKKLMAEQIKKVEASQKRAVRAAEIAAKKEREKELREEEAYKYTEVRPVTKEKDPMRGLNFMKGVTVIFVVMGLAYAGGLIYAKTQNDEYIESMEKELMGIAHAGYSDDNDRFISDGKLTVNEKLENGLTLFLPDTDKDGLSDYYEINISNTDPKNADTDSDDSYDGAELISGLNPLSADDAGKTVVNVIEYNGAKVEIEGKAQNAFASIDPVANNSILGATGIVGNVYEFYTSSSMQNCKLTISYKDEDLEALNTLPENLSIFRFNSETLAFDKFESTVDPVSKTVSAQINSIGIYTIGNTAYIQEKYNTKIFFLIDNSGSMYSEEACPGSEENDLEFKRLDFATELIDRLGESAAYGAAKFTGTYTRLSPVTSDRETVKKQIDGIRTADTYFDGTEIALSLSNAVDELGNSISDRNYIVLLTDGYPTNKDPEREEAALKKAVDNNVTVFTIGLGKRIDADYLTNIAESTNGQYFQVSNAAALDVICDKLESFMSFNKTTVSLAEETEAKDVYILADSGFNVAKDSLAYNNFRTEFSERGTDYGIAELTREYYTGELSLMADAYYTDSGDYVNSYDLRNVEQLVDGKPDLVDLKIDYLDVYNEYLELKNKWNYRASNGGLLRYTEDTALFINSHGMSIIEQPYTVQLPEMEKWFEMLQNITFQKLPEFTSYECAIINSSLLSGVDWDVINAFCYMQRLHDSSAKCDVYDFGYHGDTAYELLRTELKRGNPVVITLDGAALNAVRLLRESENTNKIVLEAYDCNNLGTTTYISLLRTPIYDGAKEAYHQYSASVGGKDVSLKMYITK